MGAFYCCFCKNIDGTKKKKYSTLESYVENFVLFFPPKRTFFVGKPSCALDRSQTFIRANYGDRYQSSNILCFSVSAMMLRLLWRTVRSSLGYTSTSNNQNKKQRECIIECIWKLFSLILMAYLCLCGEAGVAPHHLDCLPFLVHCCCPLVIQIFNCFLKSWNNYWRNFLYCDHHCFSFRIFYICICRKKILSPDTGTVIAINIELR